MKKYLKQIISGQRPITDIWHYLVGNYRYMLYYSKYKWLIRKHIQEQIEFRIEVMDKECYRKGECKGCGCSTTALQMCSKSCEGNCYPPMLPKKYWNLLPNCIKKFKSYKRLENVLRNRQSTRQS